MRVRARTKLEKLIWVQGRVQVWVADELGVDPSTVNRWIAGTWVIPPARVTELAKLLGVSKKEIV